MKRTTTMLVVMAVLVALTAGVAWAAFVQCDGAGDQDPDNRECKGTDQDDQINGSPEPDQIDALPGDDVVYGKGGEDTIRGDEGRDKLYGGPQADRLFPNKDTDTVEGRGGNDVIDVSNTGDDKALGNSGDDKMDAGEGKDQLRGNEGNDTLRSFPFPDDNLVNRLFGGTGKDTLDGANGVKDVLDCGANQDTAFFDPGIDVVRKCEIKNPVNPVGEIEALTAADKEELERLDD